MTTEDIATDRETAERLLASFILRQYDDGATVASLAIQHLLSMDTVRHIIDHWRPALGLTFSLAIVH